MNNGARSQKIQAETLRRHLLKLIAVLFSFILWFYVLNSESLEVEIKLPLVLIPAKGRALTAVPTTEVLVKVKGSRAFVRNIFQNNEKVFINLKRRGKRTKKGIFVKILASDIPHPLGVEVMSITPSRINVSTEKRLSKKIKLKAFLVGKTPAQLELLKYELVPSFIKVSGPWSLLKKLKTLETNPIDLSALEGDGRVKVLLKDLDPRLTNEDAHSEAEFLYRIKTKKANYTLKNIKIRFLTSSPQFKAVIKTVSMDVFLPEGIKKKINTSDVKVIADIPEGKKGRSIRVKLKAELPEGVHLLQIYPESINIGL